MKIIHNPVAGRGKGRRHLRLLEQSLAERGIDFQVLTTRRKGHAKEMARRLVDRGESRVVVMGGDGTIAEAINGILGSEAELGVIPIGTGNDLARSLGIPRNDIPAAVQVLESGVSKAIDLGWERDRHFVLMAAVGYPAHVAEETNRMKRLKGSPAFFAAVYKALSRMKPIPVRLLMDDRELELEITSLLIQNTPYCGGGQLMAPQASLDDGCLDVVVIGPIGKLDLMLNFPRVYRGTHITHPAFSVYRARRVEVHTPAEMVKMFDGDIDGTTPVEARALPRALRVVVPLE